METDYYKILGVERNASSEDISKAYRKKAMMYHPDRQHGKTESEKKEAESNFKKCSEAYETLSDKDKRAHYDRFGNTQGFQGGFGGQNFDPREFFRRHMQGFGFGNDFDDFDAFGNFNGFGFGGPHNRQEADPNAPKKGKDVRIRVSLKLEDMIYGVKKTFEINVNDPCEHCNGTGSDDGKYNQCPHCGGSGMLTQRHGMMIMQSTCPHCHGSGHTISKICHVCGGSGEGKARRHVEIKIPEGIISGESVVVKGEGIKGTNGGPNGDLVIEVIQEKHEIFERDRLDLLTNITIPSITAIIGGDVDIPTPWGNKKLNIPSGTNNGKTFKISGAGVKRGNSTGNLYVVVEIETMNNLTEKQKKILKELSATISVDNFKIFEKVNKRNKEFEKISEKLRKTT